MTSRPWLRNICLYCCACLSFSLILSGRPATGQSKPDVPLLRNRAASERPKLMVVGVVHFDNPGHDVVNEHMEDVLMPEPQMQIDALVNALARFKPTKIVVEWPLSRKEKLTARYADYRQGHYVLGRSEVDQLGLRLAAKLGLPEVNAVDWNENPPGVQADYDYQSYPDTPEAKDRLAAIRTPTPSAPTQSLNEKIYEINKPESLANLNRRYFDYVLLGDADRSPGANWVGAWYARNLKIFANLVRLATSPSDRVLVIYGAGHVFPLTEFAEQSGAFSVESPEPLLQTTLKTPATH
jgi:hypothetical protein